MNGHNQLAVNQLEAAKAAAQRGGDYLRECFTSGGRAESEIGRDIKLAEDREAQDLIVAILRDRSDLPVIAEEDASANPAALANPDGCWIVDPLDGTFNFKRGIPICASAIALWKNGRATHGVIYDFIGDKMYAAEVGGRATLNDQPLKVSAIRQRASAVLATGLPVNRDYSAEALASMAADFAGYKKVRMIGSAASSLALVACGAMDIYREQGCMLWDVAAGLALVEAAGGITRLTPSPKGPFVVDVVAASSEDVI